LHIRLNETDDQDIIAWLDAQLDKTASVKAAIRSMMDGRPATEHADVDLVAIRAVVEAVLDEKLSTITLGAATPGTERDPELENKLDSMF